MTRPTVYVSNWSSHRTEGHHGPGRKLSIMARPRAWEHGDGCVPWLTPDGGDLLAVKAGKISGEEYQPRFEEFVNIHATGGRLAPGRLAVDRVTVGHGFVVDGDTLCCACSRDDAAAGRCHRAWAAEALVAAGWRVILDGEEVTSCSR